MIAIAVTVKTVKMDSTATMETTLRSPSTKVIKMASTPVRMMDSVVRITIRNVHTFTGMVMATTAVMAATEILISTSRHTARVSCADTTKASVATTTIAGATTETMDVGPFNNG